MKVVFTITFYLPYVSGLTLAAARWATGLVGNGHTLTVLTMRHDPALPETESLRRVRVVRASWIARISKGFLSLDWLFRSWHLAGKNDAIVIHLPQFEGLVTAVCAKAQGKRVVSVYHCEVVLPEGFVSGIIQSLLEISNFLTLCLSDAVVTYTADYAGASNILRMVKTVRPGLKRTYIVPPIAKPRKRSALSRSIKNRIGNADIVVGIAARLAAEKGIEYVLEAIPYIRQAGRGAKVSIVIAGSMKPVGEAPYREKIMKLVKRYRKHVVFLGEISPDDMGSFYAHLDVLVLPSVNSTEAFGMVQVEAMLAGVPVIATDLPGVRVPVKKTGMGLVVPPRDPRALARAIRTVTDNPAGFRRQTERIVSAFPRDASVRSLEQLLR